MEERVGIREGHQRGCVADGRGAVASEVGHGLRAQGPRAAHAIGHPRAAALLARTGVGIQVERCDVLLRLRIRNLEEHHVRMPPLCGLVRALNCNAEEIRGDAKHAVEYLRQGEVGSERLLVVGENFLLQALGPERHVPQPQLLGVPLRCCKLLQLHQFLFGGRPRLVEQLLRQPLDRRDVLSHLRGDGLLSVVLETQHLRGTLAQLQDLRNERSVIQLALRCPCAVGAVQLLTQSRGLEVLHRRHVRRNIEREPPRPCVGCRCRCTVLGRMCLCLRLRRSCQGGGRQAGKVSRVREDEFEGLRGIQQVVLELGTQLGQLERDGVELLLCLAVKIHAGQLHLAEVGLDHPLLRLGELFALQLGERVVHRA
mmetsp:Transcript_66868/g.169631  ORF Transcript_66868/g.169631 Transcript_66868/m.169631 type:complete len:370 (-) Transcript_66868:207-1316(-)